MNRRIIPYISNLILLARKLRSDSTPGERMLWNELRHKKLLGYDFHRQKPLQNYIVDFYCAELNLIIELDGRYHTKEAQYNLDITRDKELATFDLTVIRFTEDEVKNDMFNVLRTLNDYIITYQARG